ncbi:hypothetical protein Tco_1162437 [Tanacetum coccineum]
MHVILFGTIPTTIPDTTPSVTPPSTHIDTALTPTSPDYTPASPDYSPVSDTKSDPFEDPSSDHIPPLPAISPFLSSTDDSSDSGTPDTPPSPTHGTPFTEMTLFTQSTPVTSGALCHRRVGPLPTHRLAMRHSVDYSSSDHFSSDDSSRDSSSSSSSETSSDSSADALSDSASSHSSSDHSLPASSSDHLMILLLRVLLARGVDPLLHLYRYLHLYLEHCLLHVLFLPSPKRIRSPESATDLEVSSAESSEPSKSRGTDLEMDVDVERSDGLDIDPKIQVEINECIAYTDALRARGIDARVVVEAVDQEEIEAGARGPIEVRVDRVTHPVIADDIPEPTQEERAVEVTYETLGDLVQRFHDHTEEIPVHRAHAIESIQRDQGYRIVVTGQQSADMLEMIKELERDNMRLRDMMDVASQRVTRSQHRELRVQREMRQIRRFRFYDSMRIARLEACARRHLDYSS